MNRRRLGIIAVAAVAAFSCITAVTSTIAWFRGDVSTKDELQGGMKGAYFAGGTGTSTDPYIILHPIHLYNLAWLQYLGYFNRDINGDKVLDTFYFKLSDDLPNGELDMTGYTLPPIGTERYPFIGNFNGNNKIIKELDVSNDFGDFSKHPSTVTAAGTNAFVQPQVVGFFGVIGSLPNPAYTYSSANNQFYDAGLVNVDVKTVTTSSLIGVVAGYVNGDISGVAVDASEVNVDTTATSAALTDITPNISDYGVIGHVAKKTRTKEITRVDETIYDINISDVVEFNANDQGDNQGFGGSIDMKGLYNDIVQNVWEVVTNNTLRHSDDNYVAQYSTQATQLIAKDGTVGNVLYDPNSLSSSSGNDGFTINGTENGYFTSGKSTYRRYYNYPIKDNGDETSSFGMIVETGGDPSTGDTSRSINSEKIYMCLSGERSILKSDSATLTTSYYDSNTGSFIRYVESGGTRHYLNFTGSGTAVTDAIAADDSSCTASLWTYSGGAFSTINLASTSYPNTQKYYLNCSDNGTLTVTTSAFNNWNKDALGYYATVNGTKHYLGFNGTNWTTTTYHQATEEVNYWLIHSGTSYMKHDNYNGYVGVESNPSSNPYPDTIKWYLVDNGAYFSATSSAPYSYLYLYTGYNYTNYGTGVAENVRYRYEGTQNNGDNSGHLSVTYNGTTYYPYLSGSWWDPSQNGNTYSETALTFTLHHTDAIPAGYDADIHAESISLSDEMTLYSDKKERSSTIDSYVKTAQTYMPLTSRKTTVGTITTKEFGIPDEYNTGYIVSGAKYRGDPYGDIRVSKYDTNSLNGFTLSSGEISTVYTINDRGKAETPTVTDTFTASKGRLQSVLKNTDGIYGLHFMNTVISTDGTVNSDNDSDFAVHQSNGVGHSVYASKAVINKDTYENYELPTDCIDFNLKEKGYINFFAGTYYTGNNSFFSLYEIVRDGSQNITELREISQIYSDGEIADSYQYRYSDNTYSVPFKFANGVKVKLDGSNYTPQSKQKAAQSGYSSVFKTDWIKGNSSGRYSSWQNSYAYYFEIPMNDGEYALGSVAGKNGAYLMYLDIGANAAKMQRTVVSERFTITESKMEYPLGVAIFSSVSSITDDIKKRNDEHLNLACAKISAGFSGTLSFSVNKTDSKQVDITDVENAVPIFQGDNIKLNIANKLVPKETTTKDIKRVEYWDYSVNTQEKTHVIIEFSSTDGWKNQERTIRCFDSTGAEILDNSKWKIFRSATGLKFIDLAGITYANLTSKTGDGLYYTETPDEDLSALITIRYWETETITGESAYELHMESYSKEYTNGTSKTAFRFKDYTLSVSAEGGSLIVKVLALGSRKIYIGTTEITEVGQTVTISAT